MLPQQSYRGCTRHQHRPPGPPESVVAWHALTICAGECSGHYKCQHRLLHPLEDRGIKVKSPALPDHSHGTLLKSLPSASLVSFPDAWVTAK